MVLGLLFSVLSGCGTQSSGKGLFKAGTYTGKGKGIGGEIEISLIVDENNIKEVKVVKQNETKGIADAALERIPAEVVESQGLAVDVVTGATITSEGLLAAIEDALTKAGADIKALKEKKDKDVSGKDVTYDADVVVVGGGLAGLSSALQAVYEGAKVIVVEKLPMTGGSTARSGGKILAAGTEAQKAAGIKDSADLFYEFLTEVSEGKADAAKLRSTADNSLDNFNWLVENGVEFSSKVEQLHEKYSPARGHYVAVQDQSDEADGHGWAITQPLEKKIKELGGQVLLETPAKKLITNEAGEVVGIECENANKQKVVINAKAVVLATGGYDQNKEMLAEYAKGFDPYYVTTSVGNTGDGLNMAKEVGAKLYSTGGGIFLHMDLVSRVGEVKGLYVDSKGVRFMDESDFWFTRTNELIKRNEKNMFYITDKTGGNDKILASVEQGVAIKADTLEELAQKLNMKELVATVERYNKLCKDGKDADFNKSAEYMKSLEEGPFYAIPYQKVSSGTFGGPITNEKGQVIAEAGGVVKGLYAAGEVANGDLYYTEYPGSGTSLAFGVNMGRISGLEAAKEALKK